jgi:hypothetical protein
MRYSTLVLAGLISLGCSSGDNTAPPPPFPDVSGVYNVTGRFDALPSATSSFTGTLTLTQASRQSGTLAGSAALVVGIEGDVFNINQAAALATVSPDGVLAFSLPGNASHWTFTGTQAGNAIGAGRHTLSDGATSVSGSWEATQASAAAIVAPVGGSRSMDALVQRLKRP